MDELEKRRSAHKLFNLPFAKDILRVQPTPADFSLEVWREKVRESIGLRDIVLDAANNTAIDDSDDAVSEISEIPQTTGTSWLESMPEEILESIFSYVTVDHTSDPYARPHVDLASCALTSKKLYPAAMRVMYRHVSIPQSKAFFKLMRTISTTREQLGEMVRWLDFSHYSNMGFGNARAARNQVPYLKPETLRACLDMMPNLQAFLVHEHVDEELDIKILSKVFSMPLMQALDFCACSSRPFVDSFTTVATELQNTLPALQRLSLHECTTLKEPVFEALLPRLPNLTHLDVAHTLINDAALLSIPTTAKITHLNLERCTHLTGQAVVKFLTTHPAVKDTIVYLNLATDASRHRLLDEQDVGRLLDSLPASLRSLNLGGARVDATHIPALRQLCSHLEELGLRGANLSMNSDIKRLFKRAPSPDSEEESHDEVDGTEAPPSNSLFYLDLSDIRSVTQMALSYGPNSILDRDTMPLEVIELGSEVLQEIKRRNAHVRKPEWVVKELGRRGWFVRLPPMQSTSSSYSASGNETEQQSSVVTDDGARSWKMGARWWGMRKIPVVEQDVGGMYGYFMFKRS